MSGPVLALILKITKILRFNTLFLLPHAEAIRLATGLKMFTGDFLCLGDRSFNIEKMYNVREGLTKADDSLPDRLTKIPQQSDRPDTVVPLEHMLRKYYKVRGWGQNGVPKNKKLKSLGIEI